MVLADIDHFKRINDEHGHDVGDLAIQAVAKLMTTEGRAGRLGGEEFAVLLPDAGLEDAEAVGRRLCLRARDLRIRGSRGPISLTCSFGVSTWTEGDSVDALMKRADIALYEAKTGGRNRVVSAATDLILARTA